MSTDASNEVLVSREVLESILVSGEMITDVVVERGPSPLARIVDVRWDCMRDVIVVTYDRPVDEPVLKVAHRSWIPTEGET